MSDKRVIVTTVPFGTIDPTPLRLLRDAGIECVINPLGRKLRAEEVREVIKGFPVVIAGTETIDQATLTACPELRAICRVGIGLDGVDLAAARRQDIAVSYTPDGPSPAVAELTIGLMLDLLRGISHADRVMRGQGWTRVTGRRLASCTVGVIGVGRIGQRVIRHLANGFPGVRILAHDIAPSAAAKALPDVEWVGLEEIWQRCDVVSLHVPLTDKTLGMVGERELRAMQSHAVLVNTARGGIIDEGALLHALDHDVIAGAAVDVFVEEPYTGPLGGSERSVLTCHMGSMTADCRARMEIEATEEAIRFLRGDAFVSPVPDCEYDAQSFRR